MILPLIVYILLVSLLLATGARILEEVVRRTRFPVRFLWIGVLLLTLMMAVAAPFRTATTPEITATEFTDLPEQTGDTEIAVNRYSNLPEWTVDTIRQIRDWPIEMIASYTGKESNQAAGVIWFLSTLFLLSVGLITIGRYHLLRKRWPVIKISGHEARLSPEAGPAVMGLIRPEIVVPEWLLQSSDTEQHLVMQHESEHLRSRDPILLITGCLIVALVPWNPVAWWMLYRLRLGVELDCDTRVLNKGAQPKTYGYMLLDVAGRNSGLIHGVPAFADSPSILKKRLLAMTNHRKHPSTTLTLLFTAVSTVLLFMACDSTMITDPAVIEELHAEAVDRVESGESIVIQRSDSTSNNEPLIVIDGVVIENGGLSVLNPRDIESINVIKGDEAQNLYQEQGKNGVIIVTLKPEVDRDVENEVEVEVEVKIEDTES